MKQKSENQIRSRAESDHLMNEHLKALPDLLCLFAGFNYLEGSHFDH